MRWITGSHEVGVLLVHHGRVNPLGVCILSASQSVHLLSLNIGERSPDPKPPKSGPLRQSVSWLARQKGPTWPLAKVHVGEVDDLR